MIMYVYSKWSYYGHKYCIISYSSLIMVLKIQALYAHKHFTKINFQVKNLMYKTWAGLKTDPTRDGAGKSHFKNPILQNIVWTHGTTLLKKFGKSCSHNEKRNSQYCIRSEKVVVLTLLSILHKSISFPYMLTNM